MSEWTVLIIGCVWLALVNTATFIAFAVDKSRATHNRRRIPEYALIRLAAIGGGPGGWLAMAIYRHKTAKQPFRRRFEAAFVSQVVVVTCVVILWVLLRRD